MQVLNFVLFLGIAPSLVQASSFQNIKFTFTEVTGSYSLPSAGLSEMYDYYIAPSGAKGFSSFSLTVNVESDWDFASVETCGSVQTCSSVSWNLWNRVTGTQTGSWGSTTLGSSPVVHVRIILDGMNTLQNPISQMSWTAIVPPPPTMSPTMAPTPSPTPPPTMAPTPAPSLCEGAKTVDMAQGPGLHTCALLSTSELKCWGNNGNGQLGLGDTTSRGLLASDMGTNLPAVRLGVGRTVLQASSGYEHTCAVLDNNKAKCWGRNNGGKLGTNDQTDRGGTPESMDDALPYVILPEGTLVKQISAGRDITCALLLPGNNVKCWGNGGWGDLGYSDGFTRGNTEGSMESLPDVDLGSVSTVRKLRAGNFHSHCALFENGKAKCWGLNQDGQLGLGDRVSRGLSPGDMGDNLPFLDTGVGSYVEDIAILYSEGCALLSGGCVKCWPYYGANFVQVYAPGPCTDFGTGRTAKQIAFGYSHVCALLDNNQVKCKGNNLNAELGWGFEERSYYGTMTEEQGDKWPYTDIGEPGRTVQKLIANEMGNCVILDNQSVKCWGSNDQGLLGIGSNVVASNAATSSIVNLGIVTSIPCTRSPTTAPTPAPTMAPTPSPTPSPTPAGCLPGTFLSEDGAECLPCPPGTYSNQVTGIGSQCFPCETGSFSPEYGATTCTLCPAGSITSVF